MNQEFSNLSDMLPGTVKGYLEAILYTDKEQWDTDSGSSLYSPEYAFSSQALTDAETDVKEFLTRLTDMKLISPLYNGYLNGGIPEHHIWEYVGYDFWVDRNRYGLGFWNRYFLNYDTLGKTVTFEAINFGSKVSYIGEDGLIYFEGEKEI